MATVPAGERKAEGTTGPILPALPGAVWERPRLDPGEVTQTSIPAFLRKSVDTSPVHQFTIGGPRGWGKLAQSQWKQNL